MYLVDWIIIFVSLAIVLAAGIYTQQYMRSVADFMSAGRVARRYLLAVAKDEMSGGAVVFVAAWEVTAHSGFTLGWWGSFLGPLSLIIAIAGFVIYRYRETRAMTLGQFFEIRYSKRFRLFTGGLAFFAGLLNFGILPAVGARAMVYFLGFPPELHVMGTTVQTFIPLMALFLSINLFVTTTGGLITIMMTNCIEGILSQVFYLVLIFGLLSMFHWSDIITTLSDQPPHQSLLDPWDSTGLKDFNVWYVIMGWIFWNYGTMTWQNQSSYQSAPLNAHEGRMGGLLGRWRGMGKGPVIGLLALCAMAYMHNPVNNAAVKTQELTIPDAQTREQMEIPIAVTQILPAGMRGCLCAVLLLGIFGGDSTHLHSWGSLFIQDVVLPRRKKPLTPEQHIRLLRLSITGVALFAFLFGAFLNLADYIQMWWNITQSIFMGGAGAVTIGGLYWKKGTTPAAWAAMLLGSILSLAGIVMKQLPGRQLGTWANDFYVQHLGSVPGGMLNLGNAMKETCLYLASYNSTQMAFFVMLVSGTAYVVISLLTCQQDFNMDRMLHRGAYAAITAEVGEAPIVHRKKKINWGKVIGYDDNFTKGDKWLAGGLFGWTLFWTVVTLVILVWDYFQRWSVAGWSTYYFVTGICISVFMAVTIGVWFTWGGIVDSLALFKKLREERLNPLDNGAVVNNQNLDEVGLPDAVSPLAAEKK